MEKYKCWDCNGSGIKEVYRKIDNGICYTCNGSGYTDKKPFETKMNKQRIIYLQNVENKALHFKMGKQLEKMESLEKSIMKEISVLFSNNEINEAKKQVEIMKEVNEKIKQLKEKIKELESIINWSL